ncbi:MAG: DUF1611 domain-containing protein [Planctomycetia bacterium]|nr:DUF1611 domain-containing protein [Planctomycetia bacterium]
MNTMKVFSPDSATRISEEIRSQTRISYALKIVPESNLSLLLPCPDVPSTGDIALAQVERIGKNTGLELANGRRCSLHEGDLVAVVFGNRYATQQFEGYAERDGNRCDLLSMGGLCGLVKSKHASVPEPTKLRLLGAPAGPSGKALRLHDFAVTPKSGEGHPRTVVVCGTSMDSGKTYTAMSLITGLRCTGQQVAAIKLTGTASGRDTWSMLDAGACPCLDFVDGGYPSTYRCGVEQLIQLYELLKSQTVAFGAEWVVIEIADGVLQQETAALLQSAALTDSVDAWVFATSDPVAALGGISLLRNWGIEVAAISGIISMSPLASREAQAATGIPCLTAKELQMGHLNARLLKKSSKVRHAGSLRSCGQAMLSVG